MENSVVIEDVKKEFAALTEELFGDSDRYKWYSTKDWVARGEKYGNKAEATIVIEESCWNQVLNYGAGDGKCWSRLIDMLEKHGLFYELGYSWSLHFYKI